MNGPIDVILQGGGRSGGFFEKRGEKGQGGTALTCEQWLNCLEC